MNSIINTFLFALLGIGISLTTPITNPVSAASNSERFQRCKQLLQSGELRWHSIASGIVNNGGGRNGYGGFHVKACHVSKQSCERWISNIGHEIRQLDSVRTAYCSRVN